MPKTRPVAAATLKEVAQVLEDRLPLHRRVAVLDEARSQFGERVDHQDFRAERADNPLELLEGRTDGHKGHPAACAEPRQPSHGVPQRLVKRQPDRRARRERLIEKPFSGDERRDRLAGQGGFSTFGIAPERGEAALVDQARDLHRRRLEQLGPLEGVFQHEKRAIRVGHAQAARRARPHSRRGAVLSAGPDGSDPHCSSSSTATASTSRIASA